MTDDGPMDTNTTSAESTQTRTPPPRPPLVRPVQGRMVAGVAAGLARTLNIPVGLIRFAFVVTTIFAGTGLAAYAAAWALLRNENDSKSPAEHWVDNIRGGQSWIGIALLVLVGVIVLDNVTPLSGSLLWATVLIVGGVLLYRNDIGSPRANPSAPSEPPTSSTTADLPSTTGVPAVTGSTPEPPPPAVPPVTFAPPPGPPTPPPPRSILGRLTLGIALLAVGILAIVDNLSTTVNPEPRHYLALATVAIGAGLITGAFVGRARWMILLGIFVLPPLAASPLAEVNWSANFDQSIHPATPAAIAEEYRATAGSYRFDFTDTEWSGETANLTVEMAAGEIVVFVPEGVALTGSAGVNFGELDTPEGRRAGAGNSELQFSTAGEAGTLNLDLNLGFGSIRVHYENTNQSGEFQGFGNSTSVTEGDQ